jgi:uncharacterized protein (UPF0333 family)
MDSFLTVVWEAEHRFLSLMQKDEGQGSIEYLLTIGAVVTAIVIAIAAAVTIAPFNTVVTQACDEVVQVMDAAASC